MEDKILKPGDLIFTRDNSYISRIIRSVTGGEVSHVMVYIGNGLILESSWSGVVITGLKRYTNSKSTTCIVVRPPEYIDRDKFLDSIFSRCGDEYDYKLLFGHLLARIFKFMASSVSRFDSPSKWLCYEIIGKALEDNGEVFDSDVIKFDPQLLMEKYRKEDNSWTL